LFISSPLGFFEVDQLNHGVFSGATAILVPSEGFQKAAGSRRPLNPIVAAEPN
jgi:hypothetical protein